MDIRYGKYVDLTKIKEFDEHISKEELIKLINENRVIVAYEEEDFCGWIRYNLFWDNTPFLNMIYVLESFRKKGYGQFMLEFWESKMKKEDYKLLLTSSLSNEEGQHFFRKLDYIECGNLQLEGESLEIIFSKTIV